MKTPCKDCTDREVGCHSTCDRYKAFYEANRKKNEAQISEARMNNYVNEAIRRVKSARSGWESYRNKLTPSN